VFLVIGGTVVIQGGTASMLAQLLGLRRPTDQGYAILGAHALARVFGTRLQEAGEEVVVLDANQDSTQKAQAQGLRVVFGNATEERAMLTAQLESRKGIIGLLPNSAQNILFAQKGREEGGAPRAWVALQRGPGTPEPGAVDDIGAHVLFADPQDIELWAVRIRRELTRLEVWEWTGPANGSESDTAAQIPRISRNQLLPLLLRRGDKPHLFDETTTLKKGDRVEWLVLAEVAHAAHQTLQEQGWRFGKELGMVPGEDS
jgi:hypothetical protein